MRRGFAVRNDGSSLNGPEVTLGRSLFRSLALWPLELISERDLGVAAPPYLLRPSECADANVLVLTSRRRIGK